MYSLGFLTAVHVLLNFKFFNYLLCFSVGNFFCRVLNTLPPYLNLQHCVMRIPMTGKLGLVFTGLMLRNSHTSVLGSKTIKSSLEKK